ncbi:MAG: lipoate--protein ligase [Bacillota bacterium]
MGEINIKTKVVQSHSFDPWFNLAVEEYLLNHVQDREVILYLWQNDQTVVIGRNQNAWKECAWEQLEKDGGKLARRLSGGGAVFHDLGNLNFTFLTAKKHYDLEKQLAVILHALKKFGVQAEFSGRNDLILEGRKFSGHAYYFHGSAAFHHGTILINTDMEKLTRYLKPSEKKIVSKGVDSVRSRVINLSEVSSRITVPEVRDSLRESFAQIYGHAVETVLDANDPEIRKNYAKYASWEWRFGQTPSFDLSLSERFSWGEIELGFRLQNGKIDSCTAYSDAMDEDLIGKIPEALKGHVLQKDALITALQSVAEEKKGTVIIDDLIRWLESMEI